MRARDQLMEQNIALDLARREAEMAIHARNDFLSVMNHEMRTPMHAIIALSSLLLETELTPEQRVMIETVLKSSNVLATLINDVLDLSRLEDGSLELEMGKLNLHDVLGEVITVSFLSVSSKILQNGYQSRHCWPGRRIWFLPLPNSSGLSDDTAEKYFPFELILLMYSFRDLLNVGY